MDFTIEDLVIAYRKAKADCFYENGHLTAELFANYEIDLFKNLRDLEAFLTKRRKKVIFDEHFVGKHAFVLKSIKPIKDPNLLSNPETFVFFSDGKRQFETVGELEPDFRILGQHSVNFHILSSLWIDKVGYQLEAKVSESSYGCRLKRTNQKNGKFVPKTEEDKVDKFQLGHFRSYFGDYTRWQQNGIHAVKKAISEKKKVLAVTADLKKFYHRVDPSFLLDDEFLSEIGVNLTKAELELTNLIVSAINAWSNGVLNDEYVPDSFKKNNHCGIPIGLAASKVIANLLLFYLDKEIESELLPIYYGRYVDDIFLVLEDKGNIVSRDTFWSFMLKRLDQLTIGSDFHQMNSDNLGPVFSIPYAKTSLIEFGIGKEKLFLLDGDTGTSFINALQESLNENSSEWKMLPDSENDTETLGKEITGVSSDFEEPANGLRKSDGISVQRMKFAIKLRNFEAVVDLLPKPFWFEGVRQFFDLIKGFILTPERAATYSKYYPRIIKLAIKADEPALALNVFNTIEESWDLLDSKVKKDKSLMRMAREYMRALIKESIFTSIDFTKDKYRNINWSVFWVEVNLNIDKVYSKSELLFYADLHGTPFRNIFSERTVPASWGDDRFELSEFDIFLLDRKLFNLDQRLDFIRTILGSSLDETLKSYVPKGIFFYTRPFRALEITELYRHWATPEGIPKIKSFLSLFHIPMFNGDIVQVVDQPPTDRILKLSLQDGNNNQNRKFALTSFLTEEDSWTAWVMGTGNEPDKTRYNRLFKLVNDILKCKKNIDYLLFPELSIPRKVLMYLAYKLKRYNISLIVGAEYDKRPVPSGSLQNLNNLVSNQLVYILTTHINGIVEQVYLAQEKTIPAIHEEKELYMVGGSALVPVNNFKYLINHGGFFFSGLICNDLLNIDNRQRLRGLVDALIIVEWNKDVDTYDALVHSCSNDLHCFVLQVNNRKYGDTRLRGPYKESYDRDKVRVRGGELDYFVVATLEVEKLRQFQRFYRSPDKPFKPVPTGYVMSSDRKKQYRK